MRMSFCSIMNIEEELDEISHIIDKKLDNSTKEVYIINSLMGEYGYEVNKNNKIFHFVQFLPKQTSYMNIDKVTDGYIMKNIEVKYYDSMYNCKYDAYTTQRIYYKAKN